MTSKETSDEAPGAMRLARFLARAGAAPSRRKAEDLVREGRVFLNGVRVETLGVVVDGARDVVELDGRRVAAPDDDLTLIYHKPAGVLVSRHDPHQPGPTVYDQLPAAHGWAMARLAYAGRLDLESEGLLVLSTDGELVNQLTHPSAGVEKEYWVRVSRKPAADDLRRLATGVSIGDDEPVARAIVTPLRGPVPAGEAWLAVRIAEGRKRIVRRMLAAVGLRVARLVRVREGGLTLGSLAAGQWRAMEADQVRRRMESTPRAGWTEQTREVVIAAG